MTDHFKGHSFNDKNQEAEIQYEDKKGFYLHMLEESYLLLNTKHRQQDK